MCGSQSSIIFLICTCRTYWGEGKTFAIDFILLSQEKNMKFYLNVTLKADIAYDDKIEKVFC